MITYFSLHVILVVFLEIKNSDTILFLTYQQLPTV